MFGLGVWELVLILAVIVIVFGAKRLPELGTGLGEGIKNFKKGYRDAKSLDVTQDPQDTAVSNKTEEETTSSGKNS